MPETMQAVRWYGGDSALRVEQVPIPTPGRDEVLIKVAACGVCASDLHMFDGTLPTRGPIPVIPGHEAAGVVVSMGEGVRNWFAGDHAAIFAGFECGECPECLEGGSVERCMIAKCLGIDGDGAWAEYITVKAANCVKVPKDLPLDQAAIICDAVATPFNAVMDAGGLKPGESVAIFGVGGLGTHGLQLATLFGASFVVAIDPSSQARDRAKLMGADLVIDPTEGSPSKKIREATGFRGVDLAIDFVGRNFVLKEAVASVGVGGRAIVAGVSGDRIDIGPSVMFAAQRTTLRGIMGYTREHLASLIGMAARGNLDVSASITQRFKLEDAEAAVRTLSDKAESVVRVVLIPPGSSVG